MVIFVPPGDDSDPTRHQVYDETYAYLSGLGIATPSRPGATLVDHRR